MLPDKNIEMLNNNNINLNHNNLYKEGSSEISKI